MFFQKKFGTQKNVGTLSFFSLIFLNLAMLQKNSMSQTFQMDRPNVTRSQQQAHLKSNIEVSKPNLSIQLDICLGIFFAASPIKLRPFLLAFRLSVLHRCDGNFNLLHFFQPMTITVLISVWFLVLVERSVEKVEISIVMAYDGAPE